MRCPRIHGFDVIPGMDWLVKCRSCMDCFNKTVTFKVDEASAGVILLGHKAQYGYPISFNSRWRGLLVAIMRVT